MQFLSKQHNPSQNAELIEKYLENKWDAETTVEKMNQLYKREKLANDANKKQGLQRSLFHKIMHGFKRLYSKKAVVNTNYREELMVQNGDIFPRWKKQLDQAYACLLKKTEKTVNVADFGAVGDGKTDCTRAFQQAMGSGKVKVKVPSGTFLVRGIRLPSYTHFSGEGQGETILKLIDKSPKRTRLISNANHIKGNSHIYVEGFTLDWNVDRLSPFKKTSSGNNFSSCLTFANVSYGWVRKVEAINPGLHCFDITSTYYNYAGDGLRGKGSSSFVWLDQLKGYGFGDDGITTHHSSNIIISNSHMCDPSGRAHQSGFSNSNGFEVDDGSQYVWLANNSSARCFGGVELKAHANSSAAMHTTIIGHLSVNDNRSFNFRHIGHHHKEEPASKTAVGIQAVKLVAYRPIYTPLYKKSTPRAMVISSYKKVGINNFSAIGDPGYDYHRQPVIAIQYRASHVWLDNIYVQQFNKAGADIEVFGGKNRASHVTIGHVTGTARNGPIVRAGKEVELVYSDWHGKKT
ncbi:glycoside hydrolase family 55 protein [Sediminibacillus albus]|uniref:glycoside hydrolase family 55 protein n=1 Tax=Sediminibacillus albus TaxID=407036 RepID=UPI001FE0E9D2|nr:glycoside hydrolase family 55 protein [Sediminibacillus albus]